MCVGMFMAILDIQVVASSLPAMAESLDIPEDKLSWIQTSYLIAEIIAIPLTGFLTRAISVRWLFAGSTFAFTLASIGCALSNNFAELIFLRTIQGFCGGHRKRQPALRDSAGIDPRQPLDRHRGEGHVQAPDRRAPGRQQGSER